MEIGGIDVIMRAKSINIDKVIAIFQKNWGDGVLENADLDGRREFFFYTNQQSKDLWDVGSEEAPINSMVYVMLDKLDPLDQLTLVVDDPGETVMMKVLEDIRVGIGGIIKTFPEDS